MKNNPFYPIRILAAAGLVATLFLFQNCRREKKDTAFTVSIRYDAPVTNLNPYGSVVGTNLYTCSRLFMTLGDLDPQSLELKPTMVKELPRAVTAQSGPHQGQIAYTFELLPEAKWDNGTPVTGHDIEFTLKIIMNPLQPSPFSQYYKDISAFEIDPGNPQKFTVYFAKPYMMAVEALSQFPIMPAYHYDPKHHLANIPLSDFLDANNTAKLSSNAELAAFTTEFQQPGFMNDPASISGNGAYKVQTMNDQGVILVKKADWWGDKLRDQNPLLGAYPEKLVYKTVTDENVVENMMNKGELDIIANSLSAAKYLEMKKNDSFAAHYNFNLLPPIQYNRWMFNMQDNILRDSSVRAALTHLINYDFLINTVRSGLAEPISAPVMPEQSYYAKIPQDKFDLETAKKLLAQTGWADSNGDGILDKLVKGKSTPLKLEVLVPPVSSNLKIAASLTETARLAGVELVSVQTNISEITSKTKKGTYQTALLGAALKPGLTELGQRYSSKNLAPAGDNRSRLVNPELDKLIEQISVEQDENKRNELYKRAQIIIHNAVPEAFLYAPRQPIITSKKFDAVITGSRPGYYEHLFRQK